MNVEMMRRFSFVVRLCSLMRCLWFCSGIVLVISLLKVMF